MPKLTNLHDLLQLKKLVKRNLHTVYGKHTTIIVGMGTCGIAAGASETLDAIKRELQKHGVEAQLKTVGCIGMCVKEPLVDIQLPGQKRITYANINQSRVPRIIEEHVVNGNLIQEWAIGYVPTEW